MDEMHERVDGLFIYSTASLIICLEFYRGASADSIYLDSGYPAWDGWPFLAGCISLPPT